MTIMNFLEQLACMAHHKVDIQKLIGKQPIVIQNAFITNNAKVLKDLMSDSKVLADRSTVSDRSYVIRE